MKRSVSDSILEDLEHKIVLLTGPRQCGKTTLSKQLGLTYEYLNMDNHQDVAKVGRKQWDRKKELLILDEFHKYKNWKRFIKGVYDTEGLSPKLLITGSAKMDTFKKVGDSLAGRYFSHRLYPLDIKEACDALTITPNEACEVLMQCSGFPEPFLKGSEDYYQKWHNTHYDIMLKQDLIDLTNVRDLKTIQVLAAVLSSRVGGGINYTNIASDLQVSPNSVRKWIEVLEDMYMIFQITPYHQNIARSLLKEPKIYCYDVATVEGRGAKLENMVALSLLKRIHFLQDTLGKRVALHYCRTRNGHEIDFLVKVGSNTYLIEVKSGDDELSRHFDYFAGFFDHPKCIQLVKDLKKPYSNERGYEVVDLVEWLATIDQHIV